MVRSMISSIENAPIRRFVQVDIHAAPIFLREAEHRVEMAFWVAVDRWGSSPPTSRAKPKRSISSSTVQAAPAGHSAGRNEVNIHDISQSRVAITPSMPVTPHSVSTST
jgi:hypothetical protein